MSPTPAVLFFFEKKKKKKKKKDRVNFFTPYLFSYFSFVMQLTQRIHEVAVAWDLH
jgi:hypothetical protein